ncbi:tetratricopeptide repeat protein [Fundicoccus sp. Sow4_H7]|uniref:tetratricopeptide repeat protein n=1 Tax=Fundicoccus sp. Sow4_H7 TaxID=3438784 RepID=UPI003F8EC048
MSDKFDMEAEFLKFVKKNSDLYKTEEEMVQAFLKDVFSDLAFDDEFFDIYDDVDGNPQQSMELVDEAMSTTNLKKRQSLLKQAIEAWPENYDAHVLSIEPDTNVVEKISRLEEVYDEAFDKYFMQERDGWFNFEERPFIRLQHFLGSLYLENGMYNHALDIFLDVTSMDEYDGSGVRYQLMTTYTLMDDYQSALELFEEIPNAIEDEGMIIPLLFSAVLNRDEEKAKSLLFQLNSINKHVSKLFKDDFWPLETLIELADQSFETALSLDGYVYLATVITNILPLVTSSEYLYNYLKAVYSEIKSGSKFNYKKTSETAPNSDNVIAFPKDKIRSSNDELEKPLYSGLNQKQVKALVEYQLTSFEAFEKVTENHVLSISGIGPATIKKLKDNGVKFLDI